MSATNTLMASGLLYEGSNFNVWLDSLRLILAAHCPGTRIPRNDQRHLVIGCPCGDWKDAVAIIWWQVSPHVRFRVPENSRKSLSQLLEALATVAQPFRLMDLPAEIRCRVYHFTFASEPSQIGFTLVNHKELHVQNSIGSASRFDYYKSPTHEPALVSASRQLRSEALPILYQGKRFSFRCKNSKFLERLQSHTRRRAAQPRESRWRRSSATIAGRALAINTWASKLKSDSLKLLRRVSVQLPLFGMICTSRETENLLHFSLATVDGKLELNVETHPWLKPTSQRLMTDHTAAISKLAQSLKVEGGALIMVLTSRPDIWDQLELVDD